jgi:replicative DNA helicase
MLGRPCFEVEFDDGSVIVADAEHQWLTEDRASRKSAQAAATGYKRYRNQRTFPAVRTTREIAETLRCTTADGRLNHAVTNASPLQLPEAELPIPPYAFGVWLGDGHSDWARFTSDDPEIAMHVEAEGLVANAKPTATPIPPPTCPDCDGPAVTGFGPCKACYEDHGTVQARLRTLGVLGDKHIPALYLRASEAQRRAVLAGLLDTDGTVSPTGCVQITVTNARLAADIRELVSSLGYRHGCSRRQVKGRSAATSTAYTITFSPADDVFRLERKRITLKERRAKPTPRIRTRFITAVRPIASVPVRCIQVAADHHMYLAGRAMIPTHNSTLALDVARAASIKHQMASVVFSLEMSKHEITMRLLSAEARVPLQHMRTGQMTDEDWNRLARRMGEVAGAPMFIDDSPNLTMMEIRAKARRLKQRHDLRLIIVDYLQLMSSPGRVESRQQEVSQMSRSLKLLAKELEVPVIALSQLNRGPEQRTDKKPQMSDLRESGAIEQDADIVILLHREDLYEKESPRAGEADFIVAKHRNGPTSTVVVAFQGHYSRFVDMAPA